jgi:hypothetical protein
VGFFTSIVPLQNSSPYPPSTPAFSTPSRSLRTLTNKVIDKPLTSVLLSFVFPSSDHCLATSSPRNLCARRLPRHPRLPAPIWSGPRPSRGASRDPGRNVVLLTPSISLRLVQALSYTQITRETPLIPVFVFRSLRTLSFSVSCKPCVCHSYANRRGVHQQFPTWNESLTVCNPSKVPVVLEASSRKD